jgi:Xaa-Pro aminopeptidase
MHPRLEHLRKIMAERQIDCYLVPHGDCHNSEYLAPCDERVKFISGFSGSNGFCVVTKEHALMWTDGRYYLQAGKQLFDGWQMQKMEAGVDSWFEWCGKNLQQGQKIGLDFTQYPSFVFSARFDPLSKKEISVESTENFVDLVWGAERPKRPSENLTRFHNHGMETTEKYEKIAAKMDKADVLLMTALDDIAWTLNLRGSDIEYNPVFFSYVVFWKDRDGKRAVDLYIDDKHLTDEIRQYLSSVNVTVCSYEAVSAALSGMVEKGLQISYDSRKCNSELHRIIKPNAVCQDSLVEGIKAEKTPVEQAGMMAANVRDCAAIMKYFAFLEEEL